MNCTVLKICIFWKPDRLRYICYYMARKDFGVGIFSTSYTRQRIWYTIKANNIFFHRMQPAIISLSALVYWPHFPALFQFICAFSEPFDLILFIICEQYLLFSVYRDYRSIYPLISKSKHIRKKWHNKFVIVRLDFLSYFQKWHEANWKLES